MAAGTMNITRGSVIAAVCLVQTAAMARCTHEPPAPASQPDTKPEQVPAKPPEPQPSSPGSEKPAPATTPAQPAPKPEAKDDPKPTPQPAAPTTPDPYTTPANPPLPTLDVTLGGRVYKLEQALTDEQRFHGLSGRTTIAENGGMIFVFKQARRMEFVMRDCPADIDIIFVNPLGRVTAMHHMPAGKRRTDDQLILAPPFPGAPAWTWTNESYEKSLSKYSSRYDACIAIELKGGTLKLSDTDTGTLVLKPNDKIMIEADIKALQEKAQ